MAFQKKSPTGISPNCTPNRLHPPLVEPHVLLLVFERLHQASAKLLWSLRKFEQGQCHQFQGEQFVVGKKVQDQPALFFAVKVAHVAEAELFPAGATRPAPKPDGRPGALGVAIPAPGARSS